MALVGPRKTEIILYGWFEFEAQAKDNEGHWTKVLKTKKFIAQNLADLKAYGAYLPMMSK